MISMFAALLFIGKLLWEIKLASLQAACWKFEIFFYLVYFII